MTRVTSLWIWKLRHGEQLGKTFDWRIEGRCLARFVCHVGLISALGFHGRGRGFLVVGTSFGFGMIWFSHVFPKLSLHCLTFPLLLSAFMLCLLQAFQLLQSFTPYFLQRARCSSSSTNIKSVIAVSHLYHRKSNEIEHQLSTLTSAISGSTTSIYKL